MNGAKVTLPNGNTATYHGTSSSGFVYVAGRRVYGKAAWGTTIGNYDLLRFTPKAGGKYSYLVAALPLDTRELEASGTTQH